MGIKITVKTKELVAFLLIFHLRSRRATAHLSHLTVVLLCPSISKFIVFSFFSGSSFVVSMGSFLDVSNWLNPARLTLYYQTNSSTQWVRDHCGQRTTDPCEQICDQDTG